MHASNDNSLASDLLVGAKAISEFSGFPARTIYHLCDKGVFPHFRAGDLLCARKSTILRWVSDQEGVA
ncbi:DNA-binding protein [Brucella intermedia]|uniref:DNA-binding protein n=1 Tax=Brucella intermedia TaxID=94625 RepID=UPI00165CF323|nr:DNA-binding protein [Brucella intermedia]QNQ40059.1 DNA-binding protein [Brucella intermedia]